MRAPPTLLQIIDALRECADPAARLIVARWDNGRRTGIGQEPLSVPETLRLKEIVAELLVSHQRAGAPPCQSRRSSESGSRGSHFAEIEIWRGSPQARHHGPELAPPRSGAILAGLQHVDSGPSIPNSVPGSTSVYRRNHAEHAERITVGCDEQRSSVKPYVGVPGDEWVGREPVVLQCILHYQELRLQNPVGAKR
jgi:hypothetical protein